MKERLNQLRTPERPCLHRTLLWAVGSLLLGIALGLFSKWLDNMAIDDTIWWQHLLGVLDLRNVFSWFSVWFVLALAIAVYSPGPLRAALNVFLFFAGMCASYHWYTVVFSGFNPQRYMMVWYALTLLSPLFALLCWYGKGSRLPSVVLSGLILGGMVTVCCSVGQWYFSFRSGLDALFLCLSVLILYTRPKQTLLALAIGVALSFFSPVVF